RGRSTSASCTRPASCPRRPRPSRNLRLQRRGPSGTLAVAMIIVTTGGDRFERQMALRLQRSARALGLSCELCRWSGDFQPSRDRLRFLTVMRIMAERPGVDLLSVDPDAQLLRRPDILLDETDFDVAVYYDSKT